MGEIVTLNASALLVDPSRFSPRAVPLRQDKLDRLLDAIEHGEQFEPLRVAPLADPTAEWCGCPAHWKQADRNRFVAETRAIAPWAVRPFQPQYVLLDGFARFAALWTASDGKLALSNTMPLAVTVDRTPVASAVEALARATNANLRNAQRLSDADLRGAFERMWLGRPVKASHERWTPEDGALSVAEIAEQLHRSEAWCSRYVAYSRVTYALHGLDLGPTRCALIAQLPPDDWERLVYSSSGVPMVWYVGRVCTVAEMTAAELAGLVEQWLQRTAKPVDPAAPEGEVDPEDAADDDGQYTFAFDFDLVEPASRVEDLAHNARHMAPDKLYAVYPALRRMRAAAVAACDVATKRLKAAGYEV